MAGLGGTTVEKRLPGAVYGIAAGVVALLLAVANRYGWHRDELYFLEAGHHLQWGYVDQPPFTPFVARVAELVAKDNLVVLRLLPAISAGVAVLLGALIARELGGRRSTQVLAAAVVGSSGFILGVNHLLATAAFDLTASIALLWVACRLLRTADPRWWVLFGGIAGLALLNKSLAVILVLSLAVGLLADRRWDVLASPWLAAGVGVAVLIALPNLVWQAQNGWPQIDMARVLSERLAVENRTTLLPLQLLFFGPFLVPLLWFGARWLARAAAGRPYRALVWAWPAGIVIALVTAGRPYYVFPLTLVVGLAGAIGWEERERSGRVLWTLIALNAVTSIPIALPVLPTSSVDVAAGVNEAVAETVGWPQLADQIAGVVHDLPAAEQEHVVLLTGSYGEAGAIDRFGPSRGLSPAYSPHNGYGYFRRPTDDDATVVAVRLDPAYLRRWFDDCATVAHVDNGLGVDNEVQGEPIVVCRGLKGTWSDVWPQLRFLS
jgi:4-amino-4-deoxy-L-arabinose transferase-like glycosyltransferase